MKIVLMLILLVTSSYSSSTLDKILDREVRFDAEKYPVWFEVPVKALTACFRKPTKVNWKLIDDNILVLTFTTFDPVAEETANFKMAFSELYIAGENRYIELVTRIFINGYELNPYERGDIAARIRDSNQELVLQYSEWHKKVTNSKQNNAENSLSDSIIDTSNAKKGSSSDSQPDSIGVGSKLAKISSAIPACDSIDSVFIDAQYSDQIVDEVMAIYPEQALDSGTQSVVEVLITLNKQGVVSGVEIITSGGDSFDDAVTRSVYASRFKPFLKSGCRFQCKIKKKYNFEI